MDGPGYLFRAWQYKEDKMHGLKRLHGLWYVKRDGKWSDDGMSLHSAIEYIRIIE